MILEQEPRSPCSVSFLCIFSPRSNNQIRTSSRDNVHARPGVFTIFNLNAPSGSKDLVNADYIAGVLTGYRTGS